MTSGYYAACAGLLARSQALELAAHNSANINTTGFKAHHEFYRSVWVGSNRALLSPLNRAVNNFGVLGGGVVDLRQGNLEPTGNDLDVAVEGPAFLAVQTRAGVRYTRNGAFRLGPAGQLLTAAGDPVLGESGPIQAPGGAVSISADGALSAGGMVFARLRLIEFAPRTALTPEGNSYFAAPVGSERAAVESRLRSGMVEESNQNPVAGVASLIILQRQTEMLQRALSIFHSDFNRLGVEELPRL